MNSGLTVECAVHFGTGRRSRRELRKEAGKAKVPKSRVPRISRLMALAIRFDQLLKDGVVADQAELARLGRVTRARITQIMNLSYLAPDIQEAILFLPMSEKGRDPITEQHLRPICAVADWKKQREMWEAVSLIRYKKQL
jgi:hypothetical protein